MKRLLVICGPTATGKSALAIELAKKFNGEIISADSRQVYRGLDIGSAKITHEEMQGIPHHLLDITDPQNIFTVSEFQKLAHENISEIHGRGKLPILCGGTGFYISSVIDNASFPEVPPDPELRAELEKLSKEELFSLLQQLDPTRASTVEKDNKRRLIRAIEIAKHSRPLREAPSLKERADFSVLLIGLNLPKEELQKRITERIEQRIPALFDEIKSLHDQGVSWERLDSFGLEYRYGSEYVQEKINLDEFKKILATKTWQFAKRQMMWFKRDMRIQWFEPVLDHEKIIELIKQFIL